MLTYDRSLRHAAVYQHRPTLGVQGKTSVRCFARDNLELSSNAAPDLRLELLWLTYSMLYCFSTDRITSSTATCIMIKYCDQRIRVRLHAWQCLKGFCFTLAAALACTVWRIQVLESCLIICSAVHAAGQPYCSQAQLLATMLSLRTICYSS